MSDCSSDVCFSDLSVNIWIANNDYLACYSPVTKKFKLYDERAGVDNSGFYFFAAHATTNGELIFGSNKGITYFYPENINVPDLPLSVMINGMETIDSLYNFTTGGKITLPFQANSVSFSFSAVNLLKINQVFSQFMLEGADETWKKTSSAQRVSYNKPPAGEDRKDDGEGTSGKE